jgi:hypothetical protein
MIFIARLKKSSHIYSTWRGARRIQGVVGKGTFRLAPNFEYVTGVLTPDEIDDLRNHPSVQVEMVNVIPEGFVPEVVAAKVESPVPVMAPLERPVGAVMSDGTVKPIQSSIPPVRQGQHQQHRKGGHRR